MKIKRRDPLVSIVIPTYNEAENIEPLIKDVEKRLLENGIEDFEIIIVDDNSPDGTWRIVNDLSHHDPKVKLVRRINERGLASAVLKGFSEAKGRYVLVMDADFQHPPEDVPRLIKAILENDADIAVASRYARGGGVEGWSNLRLFMSRLATYLAYLVVKESRKTSDPLSGFFIVKKEFLNGRKLRPRGYKVLLEIIARDPPKDPKIVDIPYVFKGRRSGRSKLGFSTMFDYILHLIDLSKLSKFAIVGATGMLVNLSVMAFVMRLTRIYDIGSIAGIETSIISNFILNDFWTFRKKLKGKVLARLGGYHLSSLVSAITTYLTMKGLHIALDMHPLVGQFIGILAGFTLNYLASSRVIWRK